MRLLYVLLPLLFLFACDSQSPYDNISVEITQQDQVEDDGESTPFQIELAAAINEARSQDRNCGNDFYRAGAPLALNSQLSEAARMHSQDMADHDFLGHEGTNGSTPWQRVDEAGYPASTAGENVAAGYSTIESVMDAWLGSPGHCRNIMSGSYSHVGVAMIEKPGTQYTYFWTQVFAAPR